VPGDDDLEKLDSEVSSGLGALVDAYESIDAEENPLE
jgi:hypothetical protein